MPYETPLGSVYDGGDYPAALKKLMQLIDYDGFRLKQGIAISQGRYMGIGLACVVEGGATNFGFVKLWDATRRLSPFLEQV